MLISIVIPCYNSAPFLSSSLEMLLAQDLTECEVILVNDGSSDRTLEVMNSYAEKYPGVFKVINRHNGGVSMARNIGLRHAAGRYVYFLDSDDSLKQGTLKYFREIITLHPECEMFIFGFEMHINGKPARRYDVSEDLDGSIHSGRGLTRKFMEKKLCMHICSSIYLRKFLEENCIIFKTGIRIGEDILFYLECLGKANQVFVSARICFIYQRRSDSVMSGVGTNFLNDLLEGWRLRREFLEQEGHDIGILNFFYNVSLLSLYSLYMKSKFKSDNFNNRLISAFPLRFPVCSSGNFKYRVGMMLARFLPLKTILLIVKRGGSQL